MFESCFIFWASEVSVSSLESMKWNWFFCTQADCLLHSRPFLTRLDISFSIFLEEFSCFYINYYCNVPMIRICEIDIMFINIYRNPKTWNWFRYKTFIAFELKVIQHEERDTIFLCWLLLHLPQTTCGPHLQTTGLPSVGPES